MTFTELQTKLNAYRLALSTIGYDAMTIAPKKGSAYRNQMMAFLSGEYFKTLMSEETYQLLLESEKSSNFLESESAKYYLEQINKQKNIPQDEFVAFSQLKNDAQEIWLSAREAKDYQQFEPYLLKLIDTNNKMIDYRQQDINRYDQMLDDYEKGLTQKQLDPFFNLLREELVPFIDEVIQAQGPKPAFLTQYVPVAKQREISKLIMEYLGYESSFGYLAETEHPFSSTFSINDTRITTHYDEYDFTSNIFSVIHEVGHSMYNHQVNKDFEHYPLASNMSMGMHESQSRFLENNIARSKTFWIPIYPKLQAIIPEVLGTVSLDEFIKGINYVERGLIRTEADELTYPLHVLVRYQLEKEMAEGKTENLNKRFADLMEEYLGLRPENDTLGIMQDIHWSDASFGYFPTYALGSAYAAQFMEAMKKDIPLETYLLEGNIKGIFVWLEKNIHQYGGLYQADTILNKATGKSFDPNIFVQYLKDKYSSLLGI